MSTSLFIWIGVAWIAMSFPVALLMGKLLRHARGGSDTNAPITVSSTVVDYSRSRHSNVRHGESTDNSMADTADRIHRRAVG